MSTQAQARPLDARADEYPDVALFIDGVWSEGDTRRAQDIYNPATGEVLGTVPHATAEDLDRALEAADRGFAAWRATSADERATILHRASGLMRERADSIGRTMTLEEGKPFQEARGEVMRVAKLLDWDAEEGRRDYGRIIPFESDTELTVIRAPIGPVAAFTPWNFPAGSPMRKIAAALSAGCSIVIKASEETPGTACELVRCFEEAGVPAGVLNLVFGVPADISEHLIASPTVRLVAFTGSIPVGKHLAGLAAARMKPALMELGGHAPVIVCEDANPEQAAARTAGSKFVNAGQVCTSPSRIIVHATIYDRFVEALVEHARGVKVGNGMEPGVRMGPLANPRRLQAAQDFVADARDRGAQVAMGGGPIEGPGWFFEPTVLIDVPLDARVMRDEPFCPIAPVISFGDLSEALEIANSLPYGLAAYGFTESAATASRLKHELEAGVLSINHCGGSVPEAPTGGVKESGYGREGGSEGLDSYLVTKRVSHKLR
ncbi:MAG TPA: NAD-dependent succinate-semialdehyde dehydrogenase [Solirubrobacteraceae bacterium]|nr:NAD-dependent succinate-semialdehyde dehydrogenase [Solirubrobacteraceae bacterium]